MYYTPGKYPYQNLKNGVVSGPDENPSADDTAHLRKAASSIL